MKIDSTPVSFTVHDAVSDAGIFCVWSPTVTSIGRLGRKASWSVTRSPGAIRSSARSSRISGAMVSAQALTPLPSTPTDPQQYVPSVRRTRLPDTSRYASGGLVAEVDPAGSGALLADSDGGPLPGWVMVPPQPAARASTAA